MTKSQSDNNKKEEGKPKKMSIPIKEGKVEKKDSPLVDDIDEMIDDPDFGGLRAPDDFKKQLGCGR